MFHASRFALRALPFCPGVAWRGGDLSADAFAEGFWVLGIIGVRQAWGEGVTRTETTEQELSSCCRPRSRRSRAEVFHVLTRHVFPLQKFTTLETGGKAHTEAVVGTARACLDTRPMMGTRSPVLRGKRPRKKRARKLPPQKQRQQQRQAKKRESELYLQQCSGLVCVAALFCFCLGWVDTQQ